MGTTTVLLAAGAWMALAWVSTCMFGRVVARAEDDRELAALRRDVVARSGPGSL